MDEKIIVQGNSKKYTIAIFILLLIVTSSIIAIFNYGFPKIDNRNKIIIIFTLLGLFFGLLILFLSVINSKIFVTNKRVYGISMFYHRIDLPLDSISMVSTSFLHGIAVGTSSGTIHFLGILNKLEIHKEISKLLNNRQIDNEKNNINDNEDLTKILKQYKELLDSGIITQEEFESKKAQLL